MNNILKDFSMLGVGSVHDVTSDQVISHQALLSFAFSYGLLIRRILKRRLQNSVRA
jgi:hypothetical protein